jgi:putative membrane protein
MGLKEKNILVICIDRDNDLGNKIGVIGPIIGKKDNLNVAAKLALADPSESDANTIFGAVKKMEEIKKEINNVEVATLTGHSKTNNFESDKRINEQLDYVLTSFPAEGIVLVTDGAEDDQVIPIIQSRAPIISKEVIIVKQAKEVESLYYTILNALNEPSIKRIVFLIPGLIVVLWGILYFMNLEKLFFQLISLIVGSYLILKGTGLEEIIVSGITKMIKSISLQRVSFPFYLMSILLVIIGIYSSLIAFNSVQSINFLLKIAELIKELFLFVTLSGVSFLIALSIDAIQLKKAFHLRNYFLTATAILVLWFIVDSGRAVLIGEPQATFEWFSINILTGFIIALIAYKISNLLDVRKKITKLLIGLPVYSKKGEWLGKVTEVNTKINSLKFNNLKAKKESELKPGTFIMKSGRIQIINN